MTRRPAVFRFDRKRFRWAGIPARPYKAPSDGSLTWRDVERFVLVGAAGEPTAFQLRYFEIAPGGFSSFEQHRHAHAVMIVRGGGRVRVGNAVHRVGPMDFVYIPPDVPHQFRAGREPFGFLCPVDAQRDRPQPVAAPTRASAKGSPRDSTRRSARGSPRGSARPGRVRTGSP